MEKITGNEPATGYGFANEQAHQEVSGLTIRQEFAARAMAAIIIGITGFRAEENMRGVIINRPNDVSEIACTYADALIEALNK